jgi:hypothetical protein
MRQMVLAVIALGLSLTFVSTTAAVLCTPDVVPAATLLVPYFEVDLGQCTASAGSTTVIRMTSVQAAAQLANVVLWTDWSVPVLAFDVYFTGYDVVNVDLRPILCAGELPSLQHGSPGRMIDAAELADVQASLKGEKSPKTGMCAGSPRGQSTAVGYVTVDLVTQEKAGTPADGAPYFAKTSTENALLGDYYSFATRAVTSVSDACLQCRTKGRKGRRCRQRKCKASTAMVTEARGATPAVHIEAAGMLAGGSPTFYGRYVGEDGSDRREPLPSSFHVRYGQASAPTATELIVWRDGGFSTGPVTCGGTPPWYPITLTQIVPFDEDENPVTFSTVIGLETQVVHDLVGNLPSPAGWMYVNLTPQGRSSGQGWILVRRDGVVDSAGVASFASSTCGP